LPSLKHYPDILLNGLNEIKKTVRIDGLQANIKTGDLPNTIHPTDNI
jgi:hypothetical protein